MLSFWRRRTGPMELFAEPRITAERRADGSMILRNTVPCPPAPRALGVWLEDWARKTPDRPFLAERPAPGAPWRHLAYGEARRQVRAVATALIARGLSAERPVAILSDNGVDHGVLALGAMHAGIPVAAISPAYSLMSADGAKLKSMIELLNPGLIYVADEAQFATALRRLSGVHDAEIVASRLAVPAGEGVGARSFETLTVITDDRAVDAAFSAIKPDTTARFLFTSGSTGAPKAVINTHGMLTANQEAKAAVWPFLASDPPIIVDWLPWSHTFGANHNFNMVLRNGGTIYIDGGKPAPHLIGTTLANLADVGPNIWFNVPRGYDMAVEAIRADPELGRQLFRNLRVIFYAAAALPQSVWEALGELSTKLAGRRIPMVSAWGSTETSPLATDCHFQAERSGNIGVPVPGVELKLTPNGGKMEVRVRGPNVTPGYWKNEALTAEAFDEEGFYRIGDAVRLADPERPEAGLFFDGRVSEDFKLTSGTWVSVGELRIEGISALSPIAQDIVVTGHDHDEIGFLVFPNVPACRRIAGLGEDAPLQEALGAEAVRATLRDGLLRLKEKCGGASSRYATRARLLAAPPSPDAGEITDKGYINQRAALVCRAADVGLLQGDDPAHYVGIGQP
jgi:feruloyl-CoA synthase